MNFKRFFLEAKQVGTLYHFSSLDNVLSMLRDNSIKGVNYKRFTKESGKEVTKTVFGVSLTRDKNARLDLKDNKLEAKLVLDGNKISNNYKISQYDEFSIYSNDNYHSRRMEAEEFVYGTIKDLKSFITEITIDVDLVVKHLISIRKDLLKSKYSKDQSFYNDKEIYKTIVAIDEADALDNKEELKSLIKKFIDQVADYITKKHNIKVTLK
jgi:hypothetical protein